MAKSNSVGKYSFGARKTGVSRKSYGPKMEKPKKYRGQGK